MFKERVCTYTHWQYSFIQAFTTQVTLWYLCSLDVCQIYTGARFSKCKLFIKISYFLLFFQYVLRLASYYSVNV